MREKINHTSFSMFKMLVVLAIPTMIEEVLSTLLQYVDTAMVGHLGEEATAAVNVTTTITWLIGCIYSALGIGALSLIARAEGQNDKKQITIISKQALFLAMVTGVITSGICIILSPYIPIWMGAEKTVQKNASEYFFIISLSMLFRALGTVLGATLRAVKDTKTPLYISAAANVLNIILNYLFIYKAAWGVQGAAVSSAISYIIFGILMFAAYRRNALLSWKWQEFCIIPSKLKQCIRVSLPVLGTGITSCMGYVVFARLVAGMGTTVFAAHSIAVTAETIFYIAGYGLRTATSTLVGNALGEGNPDKIRLVSKISMVVTVAMMCVNGILLYLVSDSLMSLLTNSSQVAGLGARVLRLVAFSEPFYGMMVVAEGIFYGLGKTKYPFIVETFSMWGIRILFTSLVVLVWQLDLAAVWYCMIADNVWKALFLIAGVKRQMDRL